MKIIADPNLVDKKKWSDFVKNHPYGNIFQTPEMFEVYEKTPKYTPIIFVCVDINNTIIKGILLAVIQKEYTGILGYFSSRSVIIGGPLLLNNNSEVLNLLLFNYNKLIGKKVIYSQFRNFVSQSWQKEIFINNSFKFEDHLNIILNLKIGQNQLWKKISSSRKRGIKKALKEEFTFHVSNIIDEIDEFYKLLSVSYNRIKLPFPTKEHFYSISEVFKSDNYQIFSFALNSKVVVSMYCLIFNKTIYGYYMGLTDNNEILKRRPSDLFFWEVFKWSIDMNMNYFDWMGAGKPNKSYGVRDFKLQFGGELVNFGRFEKIHKPFLYNIAKIGFIIWQKIKK